MKRTIDFNGRQLEFELVRTRDVSVRITAGPNVKAQSNWFARSVAEGGLKDKPGWFVRHEGNALGVILHYPMKRHWLRPGTGYWAVARDGMSMRFGHVMDFPLLRDAIASLYAHEERALSRWRDERDIAAAVGL